MMKASNNITWRKVTEKDYHEVLVSWWKDWEWDFYPALNQISQGYIISKDGVDTYSGFLYYTGTALAYMGFTVSNRFATVEQRRGCFDELMTIISITAKDKGVTAIVADAQSQGYCNSLKRNGFEVGDTNTTHMIKNL